MKKMRMNRLKTLLVPSARLALGLLLLMISIIQACLGQPAWLELLAQVIEVGQSATDLVTAVASLFKDKGGGPPSTHSEDEKPHS